jgi:hypothetical protein
MSMNPKNERVKSEKYKRDGAKYVCVKCKGKHFDREAAEKCHDGHGADASKPG